MNMDQGQSRVDYDSIAAELEGARNNLSVATEQINSLEKKLELARGTSDVAEQARAARGTTQSTPAPRPTVAQAIEAALRARTLDLRELSIAIGAATSAVVPILNDLRRAKKVWNVGTAAAARWSWRIGETEPTKVVRDTVRRLITEQPMTTAELVAATGVRAARISGIMVDLQRTEPGILDLAGPEHPHKKRWFLVPAGAASARLPPKVRR